MFLVAARFGDCDRNCVPMNVSPRLMVTVEANRPRQCTIENGSAARRLAEDGHITFDLYEAT
jgi:hypothetical protein